MLVAALLKRVVSATVDATSHVVDEITATVEVALDLDMPRRGMVNGTTAAATSSRQPGWLMAVVGFLVRKLYGGQ